MFNQHRPLLIHQNTVLQEIYTLAKNKDEERLTTIVGNEYDDFIKNDPSDPIINLAEEGDTESVDFLIKHFSASRDCAVEGYARGGHVDEVNQLIVLGASADRAVFGYAYGGHVDQVNALIADGIFFWAVCGYAMGGHIDQVNGLLEQGAEINDAISGYAIGGYVDQVNELLEKEANIKHAAASYAAGGHIAQNLLPLMALTKNAALRELLVKKAKKQHLSADGNALLKKVQKLNEIVQVYNISFAQSQALTIKGVREWLLQGGQLVKQNVCPAEIYFHITSFVTGVTCKDVLTLQAAVNQKLLSASQEHYLSQFKGGHFNRDQYKAKVKEAEERCHQRVNL